MRRACSAILCMAAAAMPLTAVAEPPPGPPLEEMREELGLSDEQIAKIGDIRYSARRDEITRRAELERVELELERELSKASPDESTALRLFDAAHTARGELERIHLRTRLRIRAILTPEQERELQKLAQTKPRPSRPMGRSRR